jgi:hypothetical protein
MNRTWAGQFLTWLFYANAAEIRSLMERDPALKVHTGDTLVALSPEIAAAIEGRVSHLSAGELRQIESLMDAYASRGSFRLRLSLWWLRYWIPYRSYLSQLGFRLAGN